MCTDVQVCVYVCAHVPCIYMDMGVCVVYTQPDYLAHTYLLSGSTVRAILSHLWGDDGGNSGSADGRSSKVEGGSVTGKTLTNEATCLASLEAGAINYHLSKQLPREGLLPEPHSSPPLGPLSPLISSLEALQEQHAPRRAARA